MSELEHVIEHSVMISLFVLMMMVIIDYVNVLSKGRMENALRGGKGRQYVIASFLGSTPGCLGSFMNVSLYVHGLLGFGAIVGGMIATSGDGAFVMLALFPREALLLFALLFLLGIIGAWLADRVAARAGITPCEGCDQQVLHSEEDCRCYEPVVLTRPSGLSLLRSAILLVLLVGIVAVTQGWLGPPEWNWIRVTLLASLAFSAFIVLTVPDHYLEDHVWDHIVRTHLPRVFVWTFSALFLVAFGLEYLGLEAFIRSNREWVFLLSAIVGLIPDSGPHMVFVMMYTNGLIPFSILLTNSMVQDGHGMLPLFSYSLKDALLVKTFNLVFAISVGLPLLLLGW